MEKITIRYVREGTEPLVPAEGKSDWIDLRAAEDVHLEAGEYRQIPLGVAMRLPDGYEAHIVPRSSTFRNFGLIQVNGVGIVDNAFCGDGDEWCMPVLATRPADVHKGDRICQFRIVKNQPSLEFEERGSLGSADRGGFGSTGIQ